MAPVAGGHVERENKVASGKKFECEERKKEMGGATRTRTGRRTDNFSSDFRKENELLGGKTPYPLITTRKIISLRWVQCVMLRFQLIS